MKKKELESIFANPTDKYRGKPFWAWNGELKKDELLRQTGVIREMGFGGFFMHSRSGLSTEYLGKEWFELVNAVADEGEKLGLEPWLYDEDRWPSGSAGGKVTVDPQYRMKSLVLHEMPPEKFSWSDETYCAFAADLVGIDLFDCVPVTRVTNVDTILSRRPRGAWKLLEFRITPDKPSSNYNGTTYIDTMSRAAVERFIELTHEQYKKNCGDRIGRSIRGIFTDEPHRGHCLDDRREENGEIVCSLCWTDDIFEEFRKRYGYDAEAKLPELFYRLRGEKISRLKHDYLDLADNLFLERYAEPIHRWCRENNMRFTGHVLHEDSLSNQTVPQGSLMRFYGYMDEPGVDVLSEGNRSYWIAKQLDSAARQNGQKWKLSELYGCTGWQFSLRSHKAVGDWQALYGVNQRCQHLSWYTMEGEAKRDYPASIFYQSPWYRDYPFVENYFARFGTVVTEGTVRCDTLVLNPVESVWCQVYSGWAKWIFSVSPDVKALEDHYAELFRMLTGNHIDFDYGEEQMMAQMGSVETGADGRPVLRVGKCAYRTVVVSGMLTIRGTTLALLRRFAEAGGRVVFSGEAPTYVDAVPSNEAEKFAEKAVRVPFEENALAGAVGAEIHIAEESGREAADVLTRVIDYDDAAAVALLNTDREKPTGELTVSLPQGDYTCAEEWDPETGKRWRIGGGSSVRVSLEAAGSKLILFSRGSSSAPEKPLYRVQSEQKLGGRFRYSLGEENVCVLDCAAWRWNGGVQHPAREVLKTDQDVRRSVGLELRGGEMLQPWYSKLHDDKTYGNVELEYEFFADVLPEGEVTLAGERPEFNEYYVNGVRLSCPENSGFWVDNAFRRMPVPAGALKKGRNAVTVRTAFRRSTNIEAVYLLGNFGVSLSGVKKTLTALPETLAFGQLAPAGLPFYTGRVTYVIPAEAFEGIRPAADERVMLSVPEFGGACAEAEACGEKTLLAWEPYRADITRAVREHAPVALTLVGTRRNTFGPLHCVPALLPAYGPDAFVTEGEHWTDNYNLIGSGIYGASVQLVR